MSYVCRWSSKVQLQPPGKEGKAQSASRADIFREAPISLTSSLANASSDAATTSTHYLCALAPDRRRAAAVEYLEMSHLPVQFLRARAASVAPTSDSTDDCDGSATSAPTIYSH
jgi:hypothetical protein